MDQEWLMLATTFALEDIGRHSLVGSDQLGTAAEAGASADLGAWRSGTKRLAARSMLSRRFIRVRKVVRTRLFMASDKRALPVATWANLIPDVTT